MHGSVDRLFKEYGNEQMMANEDEGDVSGSSSSIPVDIDVSQA